MGGLDFAGGGPVHISSGAAALAYSFVIGRRRDRNGQISPKAPMYRPHDVTMVVLGIVMLWFGWFGFNGGSSLNSSLRSTYAATNTNIAASCGLLTWVLVDYYYTRKWSAVAAASGALAGLVGITPACGYVPVWSAVPIGVITAFICNYSTKLKFYMNCDDGLDAFGLHGIGGYVGSTLTGFFAADYVAATDGATVIPGGWLNQNWVQLGYQLAGSTAYVENLSCANSNIMGYSFVVSYIILFLMDLVPFLKLRVDSKWEMEGLDASSMGEYAFEALTEKEAALNLEEYFGEAVQDEHGAIKSK